MRPAAKKQSPLHHNGWATSSQAVALTKVPGKPQLEHYGARVQHPRDKLSEPCGPAGLTTNYLDVTKHQKNDSQDINLGTQGDFVIPMLTADLYQHSSERPNDGPNPHQREDSQH
jgi:hypothetical protein